MPTVTSALTQLAVYDAFCDLVLASDYKRPIGANLEFQACSAPSVPEAFGSSFGTSGSNFESFGSEFGHFGSNHGTVGTNFGTLLLRGARQAQEGRMAGQIRGNTRQVARQRKCAHLRIFRMRFISVIGPSPCLLLARAFN